MKIIFIFLFCFCVENISAQVYYPIEERKYFTLNDSVFEVGEVYILKNMACQYDGPFPKENYPRLDSAIAFLKKFQELYIEVNCNTDSLGNNNYNLELSQKRADFLKRYFTFKGIDSSRIMAKGYGETQPLVWNSHADGKDYPEHRTINRRTEMKITKISFQVSKDSTQKFYFKIFSRCKQTNDLKNFCQLIDSLISWSIADIKYLEVADSIFKMSDGVFSEYDEKVVEEFYNVNNIEEFARYILIHPKSYFIGAANNYFYSLTHSGQHSVEEETFSFENDLDANLVYNTNLTKEEIAQTEKLLTQFELWK